MSILDHLFMTGEFRERESLLSGLTLEQVTVRPAGASHSIYEELWHATECQRSVIESDLVAAGAPNYPSEVPDQEQQWHDLVRQFLSGAQAAVAYAQTPDRLSVEVEPGLTMAEDLYCLAVHNAYHLGKIVALRQQIGAWPASSTAEEK